MTLFFPCMRTWYHYAFSALILNLLMKKKRKKLVPLTWGKLNKFHCLSFCALPCVSLKKKKNGSFAFSLPSHKTYKNSHIIQYYRKELTWILIHKRIAKKIKKLAKNSCNLGRINKQYKLYLVWELQLCNPSVYTFCMVYTKVYFNRIEH